MLAQGAELPETPRCLWLRFLRGYAAETHLASPPVYALLGLHLAVPFAGRLARVPPRVSFLLAGLCGSLRPPALRALRPARAPRPARARAPAPTPRALPALRACAPPARSEPAPSPCSAPCRAPGPCALPALRALLPRVAVGRGLGVVAESAIRRVDARLGYHFGGAVGQCPGSGRRVVFSAPRAPRVPPAPRSRPAPPRSARPAPRRVPRTQRPRVPRSARLAPPAWERALSPASSLCWATPLLLGNGCTPKRGC
jgi:hypothetical protein